MKSKGFLLVILGAFVLNACSVLGPKSTKSAMPSTYSEDLSSLREKYEATEAVSNRPQTETDKSPFISPTRDQGRQVNTIIDSLAYRNKQRGFIEGYSIQIYSGSSRTQATEIRTKVMENFPDLNPEIKYEQPNYKVKLGFFADRIEAYPFLSLLKKDFPGTLLVPDRISPRQQ